MAFENLVAANRGPGIDHNLLASIGQSYNQARTQGQQNRRAQEEAQRSEQFRNILAEYVGPQQAAGAEGGGQNRLSPAGPEPLPGEAINRLMAVDPERATQLQSAQQQQQLVQRRQMQERAGEAVRRMQLVLDSENPAETIRFAGRMSDGSDLMERLSQEGVINAEDGVSDDEARTVARHAIATYSPMLPVAEERAAPASVRAATAMGLDPQSEEGREFIRAVETGGSAGERLDALIQEARLSGLLREEEQAQREQQTQRESQRLSVIRNLEQNQSAVDLTQRLEGTALESGGLMPSDWKLGLAQLREGVGRLRGADTSEQSAAIADFEEQRKTLQDQVNARIASGDYGRSATQLESIERSLANPDLSPEAIIRIQGRLAQIDLDEAKAQDMEIPNQEEWERRVKEWKDYSVTSPGTISRMNREQLESLNRDELTDDQLAAAADRWDDLNAGE